mmetsp:Transcript_33616/g.132547  ORF Transcript_33616/g.132547 Transcript_33616/m.132547 type:complete len:147 (-) Transcript_33616:54-494(-)
MKTELRASAEFDGHYWRRLDALVLRPALLARLMDTEDRARQSPRALSVGIAIVAVGNGLLGRLYTGRLSDQVARLLNPDMDVLETAVGEDASPIFCELALEREVLWPACVTVSRIRCMGAVGAPFLRTQSTGEPEVVEHAAHLALL